MRWRKLGAHADWLVALVEDEPDITLAEIQPRLCEERAMAASIGTIWHFFERRDISFKKTAHAAERSVEALWRAIGRLLDRFTDEEGRNYFENAGYINTHSENALAHIAEVSAPDGIFDRDRVTSVAAVRTLSP